MTKNLKMISATEFMASVAIVVYVMCIGKLMEMSDWYALLFIPLAIVAIVRDFQII